MLTSPEMCSDTFIFSPQENGDAIKLLENIITNMPIRYFIMPNSGLLGFSIIPILGTLNNDSTEAIVMRHLPAAGIGPDAR